MKKFLLLCVSIIGMSGAYCATERPPVEIDWPADTSLPGSPPSDLEAGTIVYYKITDSGGFRYEKKVVGPKSDTDEPVIQLLLERVEKVSDCDRLYEIKNRGVREHACFIKMKELRRWVAYPSEDDAEGFLYGGDMGSLATERVLWYTKQMMEQTLAEDKRSSEYFVKINGHWRHIKKSAVNDSFVSGGGNSGCCLYWCDEENRIICGHTTEADSSMVIDQSERDTLPAIVNKSELWAIIDPKEITRHQYTGWA